VILERIAAGPCPSRVLLGAGEGDRAFALISGPGDPDLSDWSVAGLDAVGVADSFAEADALVRAGGLFAVGYEGYDRGWSFADRPRPVRADPLGMPSGRVFLYDAVYARSARTGEGRLIAAGPGAASAGGIAKLGGIAAGGIAASGIAAGGIAAGGIAAGGIAAGGIAAGGMAAGGIAAGGIAADTARRVRRLRELVASRAPISFSGSGRNSLRNALVGGVSREAHAERIRAALELIAAGEIYQVNLTYPLLGSYEGDPRAAFFRLLEASPPPFAAFLSVADDETIVSASPECFFTFDAPSRRIATYPIKGTRRRDTHEARDAELALELSRDPKERAEHLMIVDLLRNDLGRIAKLGAVAVEGLAYVESFAGVHHLTSRIVARAPAATNAGEIMRALFPGGSITGAPKLRAMETIDVLEGEARGVYTGAIGLLLPDGSARASIAIRTAQLVRGEARFGVGGGIVADSDPDREYEETLVKARALSAALRG
jgi:anthranilate/para-aminobenzoate synthase component I